jgi:hypothetical protein
MNTDILKKCIITRYDESIKEPPFLTIPIDKVDVMEPIDHKTYGHEFYLRLNRACHDKGYIFKFYTSGRELGVDYEIVVE